MNSKHENEPIRLDREGAVSSSSRPGQHSQCGKLGVLLVHGIGTQQRGDTLLQAGDALHDWLQRWLKTEVQVIDSDIAPNPACLTDPAHAHLEFTPNDKSGSIRWILAESHWAELFRALSYRDFVNWAWRVVPWTVLLHFMPRFRESWTVFHRLVTARKSPQGHSDRLALLAWLECRYPSVNFASLTEDDIRRMSWRAMGSIFVTIPLPAMGLAIVGTLMLIALSLLRAASFLLPFPAVRRFALNVQLQISSTIGDSAIYLSSPLIAATVRHKLHQGIDWLVDQGCDQVIVLAHSQGAAIAYDTIQHNLEGGRREPKLTNLITYGSGLRKLFDLRAAHQKSFRWTFYGWMLFALSIVLLGLAVGLLSSLWVLFNKFSLGAGLGAVGILASGLVSWMGIAWIMIAASELGGDDPMLLAPEFDGPEWDNFYASHDPVPNGRITVKIKQPSDDLKSLADARSAEKGFYQRQRNLTNWQSAGKDHTSYWDCTDDFGARVGNRLVELSGGDQTHIRRAWIELAAERRRWRIQIRKGLHLVAATVGLMAILSSKVIPTNVNALHEIIAKESINLFGFILWPSDSLKVADWLFRIMVMLIALAIPLIVADRGFKSWERYERKAFFDRKGYRLVAGRMVVFCIGWLALLISVPIVTVLSQPPVALRFDPLLPPLVGLVVSVFLVWQQPKPPGTQACWALQCLQIGKQLVKAQNAEHEKLNEAIMALEKSQKIFEEIGSREYEDELHLLLKEARKRITDSSTI